MEKTMKTHKLQQAVSIVIALAAIVALATGCAPTEQPGTNRVGTTELEFNPYTFPTKAEADDAFAEFDYQAATQFYVWGYAYLNNIGFDKALTEKGGEPLSIYTFDHQISPDQQIMTANSQVTYNWTRLMDVSESPLVIEVPPRVMGHIWDAGMRAISDVGGIGRDLGKGGKYFVVSKDYAGEIPEGMFEVRLDQSNQANLVFRTFATFEGSVEGAVELAGQASVKSYADMGKTSERVLMGDGEFSQDWAKDEGAFEWLAEHFNSDMLPPSGAAHAGNMRALGMNIGEEFNPNADQLAILKRAAATGKKMIAAMAFGQRTATQDLIYPDRQYVLCFASTSHDFLLANGAEEVEQRARSWHELVGNFIFDPNAAPAGKGQFAVTVYNDANGDHFHGENTYTLTMQADVPVTNFWQIPIYEVETRAMIETEHGRYAFTSTENLAVNEDGTITLVMSPTQPAGVAGSNWVQTKAGEDWFALPRLYGAKQEVVDKTWKLNDIQRADPVTLAPIVK